MILHIYTKIGPGNAQRNTKNTTPPKTNKQAKDNSYILGPVSFIERVNVEFLDSTITLLIKSIQLFFY